MIESRHTHTTYPDHNIPQAKKGKEWCRQDAQAFYNEFTKGGHNLFYNKRDEYERIRLYALGLQDVEQYKERLDMGNLDETYVVLDWTPVPVWPKFRDIILSRLRQRGHKVTATAIDPVSLEKERQFKYEQQAKLILKDFLPVAGALLGADQDVSVEDSGVNAESAPFDQPKDMAELDLHMQLNYKNRLALFAEMGVDVVLYQNDWKEVAELVRVDLVDLGAACTKDWIDANGRIRVRRCDPANILVGYSTRQDFKGVRRLGEVIQMTVQEVRAMAGDQLTEAEYRQISESATATRSSIGIREGFNLPGDNGMLHVFDYEFVSDDVWVSEEKKHATGAVHKYLKEDTFRSAGEKAGDRDEEVPEDKKSKVKRLPVQSVYRCKWIVGTDLVFDCGLGRDMKRNRSNRAEAHLSYHPYVINMLSMQNKSIGERVIPYIDQLQLTNIKLQNAIARAKSKGLAIEMSSLHGVSKGTGGEEFEPLELVTIYEQTGNILYNRIDVNGDPMSGLPIQEIENGMARDVMTFINIYNHYLDQIRAVTGLNEVADASAPAPGQLNGTTQAALDATNLALDPLYAADQAILENTAKSILMHFQSKHSNYRGENYYVNSLGQAALAMVEENGDFTHAEFGIKIEQLPDDQDKMNLERDIQMSLNKRDTTGSGGIELEDAMTVRRIAQSNVKLAEQYLIYKRRKRLEEDMARAEQQSQMNAEQQAQAAQQANEQQMQLLQMQMQMKQQELQMASGIRLAEERELHAMKKELIVLEGQVKAEHIDLKGDIDLEIIDEQIRLTDVRVDRRGENIQDGTDKQPPIKK